MQLTHIFKRQPNKFRYTEILADGDAKTHKARLDFAPCGEAEDDKTANRRSWMSEKSPLPSSLKDLLLPVYTGLGDPALLKRCLSGKTSNCNESFHSTVWRI